MIKRSNKFAWTLIIVFPVYLYCKAGISQTSGTITLLDKHVPNNDLSQDSCFAEAYCEQRIRYFSFDPAFYLVQKYSDSPYIFEECLQCSLLKLVINSDTVDLDSVYKANFNNKQIRYMAGFIEGNYVISNGVINLKLTFINLRTNTSTDTSHEYVIVYNSKNKKLISVDIRFWDK
jgi:hypothetical protein